MTTPLPATPSADAIDLAGSPLGKNVLRRDGPSKLKGEPQFLDDFPNRDVWFGGTIRSDVPHGRLLGVDFDPRFDWEQVIVVLASDIPGRNVVPVVLDDQPSLVESRIRYCGEPIGLIAAPSKHMLQSALAHVSVRTEPMPTIFDMDASLAADVALFGTDNVFRQIEIVKGEAEAAMRTAAIVIEGEYHTGPQEHMYFEPQSIQAEPLDGGVLIRGSMQCPWYLVDGVSTLLDLKPEQIRVSPCMTGGGFGGKEDVPTHIAGHAALLAWRARRRVRMTYDRIEDLKYTSKRHPSRIHHRTGWSSDGHLVAMQVAVDLDGGAYATVSPLVLQRAVAHATGVYQCEHIHITGRALATNHPPRGAFRGFGAPQAFFALESHVDECATELGLDSVELRRRNLVTDLGTLATGQNVGRDAAVDQVLEQALQESNYFVRRTEFELFNRERQNGTGLERFRRRGIGLSLFMHGTGLNGNAESIVDSEVMLRGNPDGTISVVTGQVEMGQGTYTILAQLAATGLRVPVDWVIVEPPDSREGIDSGPTVASRTAAIVGGLLISAGQQLRERVERHAGGAISDAKEFRQALANAVADESLHVRVRYRHPSDMRWDDAQQRGDPYVTYTWSCCVVALEVDTMTGEVSLLEITSAQDVGTVVHPLLAAGQVEGGVTQAIGWALFENPQWSDGVMINANMTDYTIPTAADVPPIRAVFQEHPHPRLPHGAKGLGELPANGTAPAITNAIRHALGLRFRQLPVTPEMILPAWEDRLQ